MFNKGAKSFISVSLVFLLPALYLIFTTGREELHLRLNRMNPDVLDPLFAWGTHLADGWIPTLLAIILVLFHSWRAGLLVGSSAALSGLITQFLKRQVFMAYGRPSSVIDLMPDLRLLEGVALNSQFSFPSGHTTAAFAMCMSLALLLNKRSWGIAFAILAAFLGYTRVWLSQHFTEDVVAGALVGSVFALFMFHVLYIGKWSQRAILDRPVIKRIVR